MPHSSRIPRPYRFALVLILALSWAPAAVAQSLNWEGQTGALVTPFAYTAQSPTRGVGHPAVAFHQLTAGDVVGNYFQLSGTLGLWKRAEIGYTRTVVSAGSTAALSPLFEGGFNTFHGKVNVVPENAAGTTFLPAISAGFTARTQVRHVGGVINHKNTTNGDLYLAATKTITQIPHVPVLVNAGVKETNAALMGIAGNAPDWALRGFGAIGVVLGGTVVIGSEFVQQPESIQDLPGARLPTTRSYFARVLPPGVPINIDIAVVRAAGRLMAGVDLKAETRFGLGISYRF